MNVERGTRRVIQHRHIEPHRGASVSHPDAGTAPDAVQIPTRFPAGKRSPQAR